MSVRRGRAPQAGTMQMQRGGGRKESSIFWRLHRGIAALLEQ